MLRILTIIALIISATWFYFDQNFESALAMVVSLSTLIATFFFKQREVNDKGQNQTVGDVSNAIQAGGNVSISIESKSNEDD